MPYKNLISEVLSAHADQLLNKRHPDRDYTTLFPEDEELPSLLNLADHVKDALEPVQPPTAFRKQLQQDLMAAHLEQLEHPPEGRVPMIFPILASAFIALIGLYVIKKRQNNAQP